MRIIQSFYKNRVITFRLACGKSWNIPSKSFEDKRQSKCITHSQSTLYKTSIPGDCVDVGLFVFFFVVVERKTRGQKKTCRRILPARWAFVRLGPGAGIFFERITVVVVVMKLPVEFTRITDGFGLCACICSVAAYLQSAVGYIVCVQRVLNVSPCSGSVLDECTFFFWGATHCICVACMDLFKLAQVSVSIVASRTDLNGKKEESNKKLHGWKPKMLMSISRHKIFVYEFVHLCVKI